MSTQEIWVWILFFSPMNCVSLHIYFNKGLLCIYPSCCSIERKLSEFWFFFFFLILLLTQLSLASGSLWLSGETYGFLPPELSQMHKTKHTEAKNWEIIMDTNIPVHYSSIYYSVLIHLITKSSGRSISCHNSKVVMNVNDFVLFCFLRNSQQVYYDREISVIPGDGKVTAMVCCYS